MSEEWYRNRHWDAEIEAAFETRIARSRSQKAQCLMIQGQALIEHHPGVAVQILARSIALDDEFHLNRANCYLAMAHVALGDIDAALAAYEAALEAQVRLPNFQTGAALDHAFIVAYFSRSERYSAVLPVLEAVQPSIFANTDFQVHAAHALILGDIGQGDEARVKAIAALAEFPRDAGGALGLGISFDDLRRRLVTLAGASN